MAASSSSLQPKLTYKLEDLYFDDTANAAPSKGSKDKKTQYNIDSLLVRKKAAAQSTDPAKLDDYDANITLAEKFAETHNEAKEFVHGHRDHHASLVKPKPSTTAVVANALPTTTTVTPKETKTSGLKLTHDGSQPTALHNPVVTTSTKEPVHSYQTSTLTELHATTNAIASHSEEHTNDSTIDDSKIVEVSDDNVPLLNEDGSNRQTPSLIDQMPGVQPRQGGSRPSIFSVFSPCVAFFNNMDASSICDSESCINMGGFSDRGRRLLGPSSQIMS